MLAGGAAGGLLGEAGELERHADPAAEAAKLNQDEYLKAMARGLVAAKRPAKRGRRSS